MLILLMLFDDMLIVILLGLAISKGIGDDELF